MMTALDDLLIQAKALCRAPHDPAHRRAAAAVAKAFNENPAPDIKEDGVVAGAGIVLLLITGVGAAEDPDARTKFAEALSIVVDATRLERARHAQARLASREPKRHWSEGANA